MVKSMYKIKVYSTLTIYFNSVSFFENTNTNLLCSFVFHIVLGTK